jgi:hypothetical protein
MMRKNTIRIGLNIEPLVARIKYFQLRWFGQIQRMQEGRYPKQAREAGSEGRWPKTNCMGRQHSVIMKREKMYLASSHYQGAGLCSLVNSLFNLYTAR